MKTHGLQKIVAAKAGIAPSALSMYLNLRRRPTWAIAARLARATRTKPELWLMGSPSDMRAALEKRAKSLFLESIKK